MKRSRRGLCRTCPFCFLKEFRLSDFGAGIDCVRTLHASASTGRVRVQTECPLRSSNECPSSILVWQLVFSDVLSQLHQHFDALHDWLAPGWNSGAPSIHVNHGQHSGLGMCPGTPNNNTRSELKVHVRARSLAIVLDACVPVAFPSGLSTDFTPRSSGK